MSKYACTCMLHVLKHVNVNFITELIIACSTPVPPTAATIQVSGHTPHNFSLILPSSDHTLSLTCTSDHLSQRTEMTFIWFFRGNPITGSAPPVGVVFRQNGTLLSVTGSEVFGSYQCLATNRGGSAAAVLFIYKGTCRCSIQGGEGYAWADN